VALHALDAVLLFGAPLRQQGAAVRQSHVVATAKVSVRQLQEGRGVLVVPSTQKVRAEQTVELEVTARLLEQPLDEVRIAVGAAAEGIELFFEVRSPRSQLQGSCVVDHGSATIVGAAAEAGCLPVVGQRRRTDDLASRLRQSLGELAGPSGPHQHAGDPGEPGRAGTDGSLQQGRCGLDGRDVAAAERCLGCRSRYSRRSVGGHLGSQRGGAAAAEISSGLRIVAHVQIGHEGFGRRSTFSEDSRGHLGSDAASRAGRHGEVGEQGPAGDGAAGIDGLQARTQSVVHAIGPQARLDECLERLTGGLSGRQRSPSGLEAGTVIAQCAFAAGEAGLHGWRPTVAAGFAQGSVGQAGMRR